MVREELQKLLGLGVISKSESDIICSPLMVAFKESGDIRMSVDSRNVNEAIIGDVNAPPKIDDLPFDNRRCRVPIGN
jgi:hypothetical protein